MDFILSNIVTLIIFTPLIGAVLVALWPREQVTTIRWLAFLWSLIPAALSILLAISYNQAAGGFQFEQQMPWFPQIGASYHVGVDGISVTMMLLTGLLTPLALLISWSVKERVGPFMSLFLLLEMGMMGVFGALDLLLFFVFWEFGLVPMYFLINNWGSARREYAAFKFMIYTMAGSLGLLLSIQLIGLSIGSFDMPALFARWPAFSGVNGSQFGVPVETIKAIAFWAFFVAFAIKVPIWPFHTWLPDAHTEAPTAGSMILAGVLLKLGCYGFLRLVLPLFPQQFAANAYTVALLALAAIVLGAFAAYGQTDFKRLVAYSSVNHMGFVILGVVIAALVAGAKGAGSRDAILATNGAVLQMFTHGLASAALFALVGVVYERTHTRDLSAYGGLWNAMPVYGAILIFCSMANLGLPGLSGFVSEYMVVQGSWALLWPIVAIAMLGLFMTGAFVLKALQKVLHGPLNPTWRAIPDMNRREVVALAPLMALMLAIGVYPVWIVNLFNGTITRLIGG